MKEMEIKINEGYAILKSLPMKITAKERAAGGVLGPTLVVCSVEWMFGQLTAGKL